MQVANTFNNVIRILFNPKIESFKLFDFLLVKSLDDRFLAQIIEIYDDKFDSSQNVAKLKLFYKIAANNEVMPYDNFTPNKECEIIKVNAQDVENFINQDKETFVFATDVKSSQALKVQYNFFDNEPIILADKIENANAISLNLAKKLSSKKHAIVIDFSGIIEFEEVKKIKACKNFKLPLNYATLDHVFDKCLSDASLEFQAIGIEILNAIKKYAKKQELGFIPFAAFVNVITKQYKVTPYAELQLFLMRLKKYQMQDIFAKNKKDYETLTKTIEKNDITIIDLSGLDKFWQKIYLEYVVSEVEQEIYFISRISEENFDTSLFDSIYNEKKNIKFIPNVSYNYSKLPSIMQYCKNYVLMPSLNQRTDFLDANFALSNLISEGCILFGKDTDGFLYQARDYELELQEKRKNYRKIALRMANVEEDTREEKNVSDAQKLVEELDNYEQQITKRNEETKEKDEFEEIEAKDEFREIEEQDEFQEINQKPQVQETIVENDFPRDIQEIKLSNEPQEGESIMPEIVPDSLDVTNFVATDNFIETNNFSNENQNADVVQEVQQNEEDAALMQEKAIEVEEKQANIDIQEEPQPEVQSVDFAIQEDQKNIEVSDEELDFFELTEEIDNKQEQENVIIDDVEYKVSDDSQNNIKKQIEPDITQNEEVNLSEMASTAVDNNFDDIINSKPKAREQKFDIDENTQIKVDLNDAPKEKLPVFEDEEKNKANNDEQYKTGLSVLHPKYGKGTIVKIIQYDQRQLLQIEFENSGKKLLDPKIAEIQIEQ